MAESIHALTMVIGLLFVVGASGAVFTLGIVSVCRWMKWSPVNISFHVYRADEPSDT